MNRTAHATAKVNFIMFVLVYAGGNRQQFVMFPFNGHNKQSHSP